MSLPRFALAFTLTACASASAPPSAPPPSAPSNVGPSNVRADQPVPDDDDPPPGLRLPSDVRPLRYALDLIVTPGAPRVTGTATIDLQLERPRRVVWLNADGLEVSAATVDGRPVRFEAVPGGLARITAEPPIAAGPATLRIDYAAATSHGGDAIFDVEEAGLHYTLTTFEPTSARKAFPCFDEPAFKVPFDLTLTVPRGHAALANTPALETTPLPTEPPTERVRFARTPPLPTYLLAFAVGPFDLVDLAPDPATGPLPATAGRPPLPVRGVALHGKGPRLAYQLTEAARAVLALERWFDRPYPFAKLDLVAVPGFPGAMENAALISFDEQYLMVDPVETSLARQREAANTLTHELAHQWFGNLVTMAWWDDLWLNEAFATWVATVILAETHPELDAETRRFREWKIAMAVDARASARRIHQPIASEHDIFSAFDLITYYKGAAVLAMFERWVGPAAWRAGVHRYLADHAGGNATTADLVDAISAAAGHDISAAFSTFLDQPGAPLVSVRQADHMLTFDVARVRPAGSKASPDARWLLPLLLDGGPPPVAVPILLQAAHTELPWPAPTLAGLVPNAGGRGYYQIDLPPDVARTSLATARSAVEAGVVAQGVLASVRAGRLDADLALDLFADTLRTRAEPEVVLAALELYRWVGARAERFGPAARARFEARARVVFGPLARRLGWKPRAGEPVALQLVRAELLGFMLFDARDPATRVAAIGRANKLFVANDQSDRRVIGAAAPARHFERGDLAPELVPLALGALVADGGRDRFDLVERTLFASTDPATRGDLLDALARSRDPAALDHLLDLILDARLTETELSSPLGDLLDEPRTQARALAWLEAHFDAVLARFPPFEAGFLPHRFEAFCDADTRTHLAASFGPRVAPLQGGPTSLAEALESIDLCVALLDAQRRPLERWLAR